MKRQSFVERTPAARRLLARITMSLALAALLLGCGEADPLHDEVDAAPFDCEGNLTGTVAAQEPIQEASEIARYRYEYDNQTGKLTLDVRDDSDASIAIMQIETAGPSTAMYASAGKPKEIGPGVSRILASDGSEIEFFRKSSMAYADFQTADVGDQKTLLGDGIRHSQHFVSGTKQIEILYFEDSKEEIVPDSLRLVVEAIDGKDPSVGDSYDRIVNDEDGGWRVVRHHRLDLGALTLQQHDLESTISKFLNESGYSVFSQNRALDYWRWANLDARWQRTFGAHLASCVSGEPFDPETLRPVEESAQPGEAQQSLFEVNWEACENAGFGVTSILGFGGGCRAAITVQSVAAVALCPIALYSGFRFIRSTTRCICTSYDKPRHYNIICAACNPTECAESCEFKGRQTCGDPIIADGKCVTEDEKDLFGLSDSWCACVIVGADQADDGPSCTSGDPHIITFDGLRYSSHSAGEYLAATSDNGDLEIQVRQEPWRSNICSGLAVNTAVALRIGDSVASFYVRNETTVRIDDEPVVVGLEPVAIGPARLDRIGNDFHIETPQGDSIFVEMRSDSIDLTFSPAPSRKGSLTGMFGTFNDDPADDLISSRGEVISSPFANELLDDTIVGSWSVTPQESLFFYASDETPQTFEHGSLPDTAIEDLSDDVVANARTTCIDSGVHESVIDACIIDVACTGDSAFTASHPARAPQIVARQRNADPLTGFETNGAQVDWTMVDDSTNRVLTLGDIFYPSFYLSDTEYTDTTFQVSAEAGGTEAIGVVFGWQRPTAPDSTYYKTYALVWIAESDTVSGIPVHEGLHLVYLDGDFPEINDLRTTLWAPTHASNDPSRVTLVDSAYGSDLGWNSGHVQQLIVEIDETTGLTIGAAGQRIFEVAAEDLPTDSLAGRFGFMSLSSRVEFSNFATFPNSQVSK